MIYNSVSELIGNTPMVRLSNIERKYNLKCRLLAKVEYFNPAGSVKDRVAKGMIESAIKSGELKEGGTIIEATSGNTGIGLSLLGSAYGFNVIIVMPDSMSRERITAMEAYGTKVVLTDGKLGMAGAIKKAEELKAEIDGAYIPAQFENSSNPRAHYDTTGPEIFENTEGRVDIFVSCIGTGGTISGISRYLKERKPEVKTIGIEPSASPLISKGISGSHKIQGIGANFVPNTFDRSLCDEIVTVSDSEAYEGARVLAKNEGLLVGISSGAALMGALKVIENEKDKTVVILLPDTGLRYFSSDLF